MGDYFELLEAFNEYSRNYFSNNYFLNKELQSAFVEFYYPMQAYTFICHMFYQKIEPGSLPPPGHHSRNQRDTLHNKVVDNYTEAKKQLALEIYKFMHEN